MRDFFLFLGGDTHLTTASEKRGGERVCGGGVRGEGLGGASLIEKSAFSNLT